MKAIQSHKANAALMVQFVSRSVIHRLNFPKREAGGKSDSDLAKLSAKARSGAEFRMRKASLGEKSRPLLTKEEEQEVTQAIGLALTASRAFETGKLTPLAWLMSFREARKAIGIDRRWKPTGGNSEEILSSMLVPLPDLESDARRRMALARRVSYLRSCLFAAFEADESRKRRSAYRGHVFTLARIVSGTLRHRGMTNLEISATGKRVARMVETIAKGEAILNDAANMEATAKARPRSQWKPLETLQSSRMPAKHRPRLAAALGFNP